MSDATSPDQFKGYAAHEKQSETFDLTPFSYEPRAFTDDDVDIKIESCGICGSDIHTLTSGWGATKYPIIAGHEIVGTVVRAGKNSRHQVGDRVGFGAQCGSCGQSDCRACSIGAENCCKRSWLGTYGGSTPEAGKQTQGGYANYYRGSSKFAVKFPQELASDQAPLLCAGITVFNPLFHYGCKEGKKVGVVGLGGLGHLGVQFAKALGAQVHVLSHSTSKQSDATKLGADGFIVTKDVKQVVKEWGQYFDILICTSFQEDMPLESLYLPLLAPRGNMVILGLPEKKFDAMRPQVLFGRSLTGSLIGAPGEIEEMLRVAVKHNVRVWSETRPMSEASQAVTDMHQGKARYRYVLVPDQGSKAAL